MKSNKLYLKRKHAFALLSNLYLHRENLFKRLFLRQISVLIALYGTFLFKFTFQVTYHQKKIYFSMYTAKMYHMMLWYMSASIQGDELFHFVKWQYRTVWWQLLNEQDKSVLAFFEKSIHEKLKLDTTLIMEPYEEK